MPGNPRKLRYGTRFNIIGIKIHYRKKPLHEILDILRTPIFDESSDE
jgi:hypothetical protein